MISVIYVGVGTIQVGQRDDCLTEEDDTSPLSTSFQQVSSCNIVYNGELSVPPGGIPIIRQSQNECHHLPGTTVTSNVTYTNICIGKYSIVCHSFEQYVRISLNVITKLFFVIFLFEIFYIDINNK